MELDELKSTWSALDERLHKNELLNSRIIKEMIAGKASSAWNRLVKWEQIGFVMIVLCGILFICLELFANIRWADQRGIWLAYILIPAALLWPGGKLLWMYRFDLTSMDVKTISKFMNTYKKCSFWEIVISAVIILPVILFTIKIILTANLSFPQVRLIILVVFFSCLFVYMLWYYKRIFTKSINELRQSAKEIEEFEKE